MCEAQRPGKLRLAGGVRGVHANTMRVEDAKKAAKLQGGITQQSAEDATFQQSGVDVESARSAGLIPPVHSALVRAFANHKPLAPKETMAPEGGSSAPKVGPLTLVQASPTILSTVNLNVRKQLDDKCAAAFYEFGIPFEVASSEAFCDAVEDTARLVRMPDDRFALVLTGLGAGKVGARRLHEPTPQETRHLAIFSTMQTRASKTASKMRCSLSWGRPARSYLMGAGAVPSGRCGIASCSRRWVSFASKSATPPVGRLGRGQEGATRFRCSCLKPADLHRRSRATLEGVCAHSLSKADPKLVRVHYNLSAP
jgi:hypothetical protein